ncbi:MAG: histidinol-phosphatase HisJ family protein [Bacteroides sp.]|nr:histidinol-phosphatase HisJ family protein [Bacteroides sp.]
MTDLKIITEQTRDYNFHAHTQFCDGRDDIATIARAAEKVGMKHFAFTPHSPINITSPCNMKKEQMTEYLYEMKRIQSEYEGRMNILTSLEIDGLGSEYGPHIDYFQNLPLDFRLGSVHFVPNQDGIFLDCDGKFERFNQYLKEGYKGDLRYVVEKYFEQVLIMIERGGFGLLGHFDKIMGNASLVDPTIENQGWYEALIDDVVSHVKSSGMIVEINTKAFYDKGRFFPNECWWHKLQVAKISLAINSDAHYAEKVTAGRTEAFRRLQEQENK